MQKSNSLIFILKTYKQLLQRQQQADKALPDNLEQGEFIARLQHMALAHKLTLKKLLPGEVQSETGLLMLPVQVEMQGDYFAMLSFLRALQHEERFMQFKQLALNTQEGGLVGKFTLVIFAKHIAFGG